MALESGLDKSNPRYVASIWDNKGYVLNEMGECEGAKESCDKALDFDRKYSSAWHNKIYASLYIGLKTLKKSIFANTASIFKTALSEVDNKEEFIAKINRSIISWFKKVIFECNINSKEELILLLNEFEETFRGLNMKIPSPEEIKKECIRSEKYEKNKDKVERIFG